MKMRDRSDKPVLLLLGCLACFAVTEIVNADGKFIFKILA